MYNYVGVRFMTSDKSEKPESKLYIYNYNAASYYLNPGERYQIISESGYDYNNAIVEICALYTFEQERALTKNSSCFCNKNSNFITEDKIEIKKIKSFKYFGLNPCCKSEDYKKIRKKIGFSLNFEKPIVYNNKCYRDMKELMDNIYSYNCTNKSIISSIEEREEYARISCGTDLNSITPTGICSSIDSSITNKLYGDYKNNGFIIGNDTNNITIDNNGITIKSNNLIFENNDDKKENKNMNIFGNLNFGQYKGSDIKFSMKGLAYKTNENTYVAYDEVEKNLINVTDFIIDINNMIFMLPAALKNIVVGDIINHNKEFVIVTEVNSDSNSITVISPKNKEIKIIMPERNIFGFDFVSKVFCPISENIFGTMDKDNPFGTMLPFLMMKGENFDMKSLMLAQMMTNGGIDFQNNPMMLYFLMEDKNNEMNNSLPYLMMMGNMTNNSN